MTSICRGLRVVLMLHCVLASLALAAPKGPARRQALQTPEQCRVALEDERLAQPERRFAFRRLLYHPDTEDEAIKRGLADRDAGIRALAAFELYRRRGAAAIPQLKTMFKDPSPEMGIVLVEVGRTMPDRKAGLAFLLELKDATSSLEIKRRISQAIGFKFYRENRPFSQNPVHDHQIILVQSIPLPLKGWRFRTDPENSGHLLKQPYYLEKFPDGGWAPIAIGDVWENQGFKGYDGFAWYRLKFTLPKEIPGKATELCFGAVDECAWVWLNGVFIGQHDEGPKGWSTPFRLEVTKEVRWGAENTLVVRVEDSEQAGGIWKPVVLEVLK